MMWRSRGARAALFTLIAASTFGLVTAIASAQTKKRERKPRAKPDAGQVVQGAANPDAGAAPLATKAETTSTGKTSAAASAGDAGVLESKTLDGGARVFRFGEMEIEGRLRNPQLVYFLRRVRAEFAAGDLGHRSFMQELSETKKEPAF